MVKLSRKPLFSPGPQALSAAFFGPVAPGNPVVDSFEAELRDVLGFLRRLRGAGEAKSAKQRELHRRGKSFPPCGKDFWPRSIAVWALPCAHYYWVRANTLFNIWIKYKPRLPEWYYNEKLLKVGDSLAQIKEYKLALLQCYGRYLQQFVSVSLDDITHDVHQFKSTFFPNGFRDKSAALTFHALQERNVCIYQMVFSSDRNLQNPESLHTCFSVLSSLQLTMQVALPQENLCWLVYNGTIHIYNICRHLMMRGQSAKVLEYLLWASICMESSIPLLAVHYLPWRTTLYAAVSQCYFDCQASIHGEVFARRGLLKIDELKQLEKISSSVENSETKKIFQEATLKMSVMIFKRAVYESRRKSKSYLRPKLKLTLKEAQNLPWPRNATDQLLIAMFDGAAAQFFAILEALADSSRRVVHLNPPVPDETEIRDVISELFYAGLEILSGGVSSDTQGSQCTNHFGIIDASSSHLQLILAGEEKVSADAAVKFIKLAFSYEEWDVFDSALELFINFLQEQKLAQDDPTWKKAEMEFKLLILMRPLLFPGIIKHVSETNSKGDGRPHSSEKEQTLRKDSLKHEEPYDLIILARTMLSSVSTSEENTHPDKEILLDAIMFLWQKCKTELQQIQTTGSDYLKYKAYQWFYLLWIINEVIQKSSTADSNVIMVAEISLWLTVTLESIADSTSTSEKKEERSVSPEDETCDMPEILKKSSTEQLQVAYESLEKAINVMNTFHLMTLLPDGKLIFDNCYTKVDSNYQKLNSLLGCGDDKTGTENGFLMDLHLELIQAQHRVAVKLLKSTQGVPNNSPRPVSSKSPVKNIKDCHYLTETFIMKKIKKNKLSRAIFLMQKAVQMFPEALAASSQRQLLEFIFQPKSLVQCMVLKGFKENLSCSNLSYLFSQKSVICPRHLQALHLWEMDLLALICTEQLAEEALTLIEQVEAEQSALYHSLKEAVSSQQKSRTPPPPLLLFRSHCSMTFKPAPFSSDVQVSWYSILGCVAGRNNMKIMLNNNKSKAGEEVPADGKSLLEIQGLDPNEKYIFALAAYSSDGKLIGDDIGEATKPILAYPPLSVTTVRAYLTQVAYQTGYYKVAREAFSPLWDYFVSNSPLTANAAVISAISDLSVSQTRLSFEAVSQTSPITLHHFLRGIFAICDINVVEGALFCDSICANETLYKEQAVRLAECDRMTVAIDLSSWLNDASYILQSVVQCYGLLVPLIYHKIFTVPVVQILIKCLTVLQEIPKATLQRSQAGCYESIQHMIACASFYTAQVLRSWKEYELAVIIINYGKKLLDCSPTISPCPSGAMKKEETHTKKDKTPSAKKSHLAAVEKATENLNVLETNLLRLTKPGCGSELTGQEDPFFLYPVISCWTSDSAYQEVMKFRNKTRFLEFFVQVLHKILNEEKFQSVLEWAGNVQVYLNRRNDNLLCISGTSTYGPGSPGTDRHTTSAGEFHTGKESSSLKKPKSSTLKKPRKKTTSTPIQKRQTLRQYLMKHPNILESPQLQRKSQQELERVARNTLVVLLKPIVNNYLNKKMFHHMCLEEMPWRSQMNIYLAVAHYNLLKKELEKQYNFGICGSQHLDSYNILDPEIFSLNNSGTVVVREAIENMRTTTPPSLLKMSEMTENQTCTEKSEHSFKLGGTDAPQTQTTDNTEISVSRSHEENNKFLSNTLLEHFTNIFLHLRRAVVLAHRGGHWTLLQNACRELWNYTQEFQLIANYSHSLMDSFPITRDILMNTIWLPFYLASDMIIDMINELQASRSLKIVDPEGDFCIPSCTGGIKDENGGSNLHTQSPLDDVNVVDLKWICHLILKTVELLYQLKKWEALVHIAVQFNIFTHERYTEQVTPLLVYAQRQLLEKMQQLSGLDSPEPHFIKYLSDDTNKMSCRNYISQKLQLPVASSASEQIFPGCISYPEEKNDNTDNSRVKALLYLPLDVNDTLKCFRETLQKSNYRNRALRHSRKILSLFLAHTQENIGRAISSHMSPNRTLEFNVGAELKLLPTPRDLSQEDFNFSSTIESKPIPQSHLSMVISSYEQTIGILEINKQKDLKVQALHELGNLHFYSGKKRAAFKYWCQALDETLNISDALNNWQELVFPKNATDCSAVGRSTDISQKFLSQAGVWGCLHAAVLVAKIAQHITTSKVRLRTKYCWFSALLFKTLFRASLPHPTSDCDFAQYEAKMLIPGIDLFSDRYRADISTVVASLNFLMFELHGAKQNLIILPLFTLYQYFVSEICKDPAKSIEGRILKIKVLTDIGFFTEAFHELSLLTRGERIPWKVPAGYRKVEQMKALQKFDSSESLLTVTNLQVLEDIFNCSLSLTVVPLCNQQILNKLTLAKMHLIICLSDTVNKIPEKVEKQFYSVDNNILHEPSRITASSEKDDKNPRQEEQIGRMVQLVEHKDELNMAMLKGILLTEAEESLNDLMQNIQDKYDGDIAKCSAADLEALIEAKLQLAAIHQQRHQAAFSVALAFSAIRLLQDAKIFSMEVPRFQEEKDERQCLDFYPEDLGMPQRMTAHDHVNVHLWLRCRAMLVTALAAQIHGVGDVAANVVSERRSVLEEVKVEAEAFGDTETQAEMMVQAALLDLQEKRPVGDIQLLLQNIISLLQEDTFISPPASLTLVKSMLLLADIVTLQPGEDTEHCSSTVEPLNLLNLAHELTIKAIVACGEPIEQQVEDSTLTCLVLPTKNIYLPHINLLAQVKMRIGNTLAEKVACTPAREDPLQWLRALKHLESALKLCRSSATKKLDMEAELLFQIGKVEHQLCEAGNNKSSQAVETLLEAIQLSQEHDQKFELIRRSYLEIALLYLHFATKNEDVSQTDKMVPSKSNVSSEEHFPPEEAQKSEGYKVKAWIAVRAATQVSEAALASQLLIGMKSVKEHCMQDAVQQKIPAFASMDLLASYRDFLSDGYNVVSESPTASSPENNEIPQEDQSPSEGMESPATQASQKEKTVTWLLLIRYHSYLKRLYNTNLFGDGHLSSAFDTGLVLRIAEMHSFFKKHLLEYSVCCLENFPEILHDVDLPLDRLADSSEVSLEMTGNTSTMSPERAASPVPVTTEADDQLDSGAANASKKEISIQWYIPSLAKPSDDAETKVLLLYAYNTKPVKISNTKIFSSMSTFSGHLWIPLARILSLRDKFSNLKLQVEILMHHSKSSFSAPEAASFLDQSENSAIIPSKVPQMDAEKVHLDEKTEEMAKRCLSEVKALLSGVPAPSLPLSEIPFEVTLQSIANLEDMFDPANGCKITEESLFNWIISLFH